MIAPGDIDGALGKLGPALPAPTERANGDSKGLLLLQIALLPRLPMPMGSQGPAPDDFQGAGAHAAPRIVQCTIDDPKELHVDQARVSELIGDAKEGVVLVAVAHFQPHEAMGDAQGNGAPSFEALREMNGGQMAPSPVLGRGFFAILPLGAPAIGDESPGVTPGS
jgi:hypothetical protein